MRRRRQAEARGHRAVDLIPLDADVPPAAARDSTARLSQSAAVDPVVDDQCPVDPQPDPAAQLEEDRVRFRALEPDLAGPEDADRVRDVAARLDEVVELPAIEVDVRIPVEA